MDEFWITLLSSLGFGAPVAVSFGYAIKRLWTKIESMEARCEICAKAHEAKLHEVYGLVIQTLKEAAHEPPK